MKFSMMAVLAAFVALFGFAGTGASGEVDAPVAFAGGNLFPGRAVKVSRDFGFDAADSTRFLQAALSSGAAMVVVDRQASDWVVTCLTGAPNQKVVFEKGVVEAGRVQGAQRLPLEIQWLHERCSFRLRRHVEDGARGLRCAALREKRVAARP